MQLYHCGKKTHNFGDYLNVWFWNQCLPGVLDDDPGEVVFGIGTILGSGKPMPTVTRRIHVLGSGYGYGDQPPDPRLQVWFVRGPRTAAKLRLEAARAISDPAMLLPRLVSAPCPANTYPAAFIPHIGSMLLCNWATPCSLAGVHLIDPRLPTLEFIAAVRASRLVLAESLHGAMVADAFGIPWIPVASSREILTFKWQDWLDTLGLDYHPCPLPRRTPWGWGRIRGGLRRLTDDLGLSPHPAKPRPASLFRKQPGYEACAEGLARASREPPMLSPESIRHRIADRLEEAIQAFARFVRDRNGAQRQCSRT